MFAVRSVHTGGRWRCDVAGGLQAYEAMHPSASSLSRSLSAHIRVKQVFVVLAHLALELAAAGLRSDALPVLKGPLQLELQDSLGRAPPRPATSDVVESGSAAISRIVSKVQSSAHTGDPGRRQGVT